MPQLQAIQGSTEHEDLPDRIRFDQLARALGNTNKEVLDALSELDGRVRTVHSGVDRDDAIRVREILFVQPLENIPGFSHAPARTAQKPQEPGAQPLQAPSGKASDEPRYMPLFVSPQPVATGKVRDEDTDDAMDDGEDSDDSDEPTTPTTDQDQTGPGRPGNRRRRRGRRGRGRGRGEQGGPTARARGRRHGADDEADDDGEQSDGESDDDDENGSSEAGTRRRRRRRRRKSGGMRTTGKGPLRTIRRIPSCMSARPAASPVAAQALPVLEARATPKSGASRARPGWRPSDNGAETGATPDGAGRRS